MIPEHGPSLDSALRKVIWFAIVQFFGVVLGWGASFYLFSAIFNLYALGVNPASDQNECGSRSAFPSNRARSPLGVGHNNCGVGTPNVRLPRPVKGGQGQIRNSSGFHGRDDGRRSFGRDSGFLDC